jgi:hypothetical protein
MADDEDSLLISYDKAEQILGRAGLNQLIAPGRLRPFPLNDRPGAPSMLPRSRVARMARAMEAFKHQRRGSGG